MNICGQFHIDAATLPAAKGAYVLLIDLPYDLLVRMPRRPDTVLDAGRYLYSGSANGMGGIKARVGRHMRHDKSVRWHIDQLTTSGKVIGAWVVPGGSECELVARLSMLPKPIHGLSMSTSPLNSISRSKTRRRPPPEKFGDALLPHAAAIKCRRPPLFFFMVQPIRTWQTLRASPMTANSKGTVVAKPEWGTKHICDSCGARFYDLLRSPVTCAVCGAVVESKPILRSRPIPSRRAAAVAAIAPLAVAELVSDPAAIEEVEVDGIDGGDDDESGLIEDTSDLGAEDDDPANYVAAELEAEF